MVPNKQLALVVNDDYEMHLKWTKYDDFRKRWSEEQNSESTVKYVGVPEHVSR